MRGRRRTVPELVRIVDERNPRFAEAVAGDVRIAARQRGSTRPLDTPRQLVVEAVRLVWETDAFGALLLYRVKAACLRRGIPVVPRLAHRLAMAWAELSIGDRVIVAPGVLVPHGQVVIDGLVEIHEGVRIRPFVTIGLREGELKGPRILRDVKIGTGAKVIGPVWVGEGAVIGANAVVVDNVAAGATVVGIPARPIGDSSAAADPTGA